jgi:uncharacterized membrane protein YgaE (UPF0421/DUF939 family)
MTFFNKMLIRRYTIITMKYLLAVVVSLHIAVYYSIPDYLSTVFVSVVILQPNLYRGIIVSWQQVKGSILGMGVTVIVVYGSGGHLLDEWWIYQAALAMGLTILLTFLLSLTDATVISTFTVAYLTCLPRMIGETMMSTLHIRVSTIFIGIGVGVSLNFLSSFLRYRDRIAINLAESSDQLRNLIHFIWNTLSQSDSPAHDQTENCLNQARNLRQKLIEVEVDLEEIQKSVGTMNRQESTNYQHDLNVLYAIKDAVHNLWGILLILHKNTPETETIGWIREELERMMPQMSSISRSLSHKEPETDSIQLDANWETRIRERQSSLEPTEKQEVITSLSTFIRNFYRSIDQLIDRIDTD